MDSKKLLFKFTTVEYGNARKLRLTDQYMKQKKKLYRAKESEFTSYEWIISDSDSELLVKNGKNGMMKVQLQKKLTYVCIFASLFDHKIEWIGVQKLKRIRASAFVRNSDYPSQIVEVSTRPTFWIRHSSRLQPNLQQIMTAEVGYSTWIASQKEENKTRNKMHQR